MHSRYANLILTIFKLSLGSFIAYFKTTATFFFEHVAAFIQVL